MWIPYNKREDINVFIVPCNQIPKVLLTGVSCYIELIRPLPSNNCNCQHTPILSILPSNHKYSNMVENGWLSRNKTLGSCSRTIQLYATAKGSEKQK